MGLLCTYMPLARIAWFIHPWLSVAVTVTVIYVLHQREFQSRTLHALTGPGIVNRSLQLPPNT